MANVYNVQLDTSETIIAQGGKTPRNVLTLRLVNTDTTTRTFSLYLYPDGGSAGDTTIIKKDYPIGTGDDYYFSKEELFRLDHGETLSGIADVAGKITATINYEDK